MRTQRKNPERNWSGIMDKFQQGYQTALQDVNRPIGTSFLTDWKVRIMTRRLIAAGKIGPAFATYTSDTERARRRVALNLTPALCGRVVVNIDRAALLNDLGLPYSRNCDGMYYVGTDVYTIMTDAMIDAQESSASWLAYYARSQERIEAAARADRRHAFWRAWHAAMPSTRALTV